MNVAHTWNVNDIINTSLVSVIILNQPILCPVNILLPIWERALVRITADGGSNRWRSFEEKLLPQVTLPPQYTTGDFDSITNSTIEYLRSKNVTMIPTPDQDATDFTKALMTVNDILKQKNMSIDYAVNVCEHGGRLDHIMANLETLHHVEKWGVKWRPVILTENTLTWLLPPGRHTIEIPEVCVQKALPCGLIPLSGPTTVTTKGLKWDLDAGVLSFGELVSTSNTFLRTNIEVETDKSLVWTMQFLQDHSSS